MGFFKNLIMKKATEQVLDLLEGNEVNTDKVGSLANIISSCVGNISNPITVECNNITMSGEWVIGFLPFLIKSEKFNLEIDKVYNVYCIDEYLCKLRYKECNKEYITEVCERGSKEYKEMKCVMRDIDDIAFAKKIIEMDKGHDLRGD